MFSRKLVKRILTLILLTMMLAGCGGSSGSSGKALAPTSTASNEAATSNEPLNPNGKIVMEADGLSIQSRTNRGIGCPPDYFSYTPNALVLAEDRLDYDAGETQQMQSYIDALPRSPIYLNDRLYTDPPAPLREVLGSLTGHIAQWNLSNETKGCIGSLIITNVGNTPIQLSQVTAQLLTAPQKNDMHYRLINVCMQQTNLDKSGPPGCPGEPGGGATIYQADFHLKMEGNSAEFKGQLHEYTNPEPITGGVTLQPRDSIELILNFLSSENLIYSLAPKLVLDIAGEQRQIVLPESRLAFANADQFSCYELQGTRFVELQQTSTASDPIYDNIWCL